MTQPCILPAEDLVAYGDGYLTGARRELVEAHLAACPYCQQRAAAFADVDRVMREGTPLVDDPGGRAEVGARLRDEVSRHRLPPRLLAALLLLLALALALGSVPATEAGFPLGRFIRFAAVEVKQLLPEEAQRRLEHAAPSGPDVLEPAFRTVAPARLPLDLVLAEQSTPNPARLELLYRNESGLAVLVAEAPTGTGTVRLEAPGTEVVLVRGIEVLWLKDPRPDAVASLFWEHDGLVVELVVIDSPTGARGGLKLPDALPIVEALMAAQDAAPE